VPINQEQGWRTGHHALSHSPWMVQPSPAESGAPIVLHCRQMGAAPVFSRGICRRTCGSAIRRDACRQSLPINPCYNLYWFRGCRFSNCELRFRYKHCKRRSPGRITAGLAPPGVTPTEATMKLSLITASVLAYTLFAAMMICEARLLAIY